MTSAVFVKSLEAYFGKAYTPLARQVIADHYASWSPAALDHLLKVTLESEADLPMLGRIRRHEEEARARRQEDLPPPDRPRLEDLPMTNEQRAWMADALAGLKTKLSRRNA